VSYPLSTSHFKAFELDEIQCKATRAITRHCGYWKGTAWPIIYGPSGYGGAAFLNFVDSQGLQQIQVVIKHWRTPSAMCDLTRVFLSWWQFVAGTSTPILEDHRCLPQIWKESKYIESLRQYLISIGATIEVDNDYILPVQRENDAYLMDLVMDSKRFSVTQIAYINWCRLYLQILTVSDMAQANGLWINKATNFGHICLKSSRTKMKHCHQERPEAEYVWALWRRACAVVFHKNGKIRTHLGRWLMPASQLRREWPAYYDRHADCMYRPTADGFTVHEKQFTGYNYTSSDTVSALPLAAVPADLEDGNLTLQKCRRYSRLKAPAPPPLPPTNWRQYFNTFDEWERQLFISLFISNDVTEFELAGILQSGAFIVASDGAAPDRASYGWILATLDGNRIVTCSGPVTGTKPNSFRAESYGILSSLRFVIRFLQYFQQPTFKSYTHITDAQSVLDRLAEVLKHEDHYANSTLEPEWDVINEIHQSLKQFTNRPTLAYEKGHQDKHKKYHKLALRAQLNCDADGLATNYIKRTDPYGTPGIDETKVILFPHACAQLHLQSGTVTSKLKKPLTLASRGPPLLEHIRATNDWDPSTTDLVDWDSHGIAVRSIPTKSQ